MNILRNISSEMNAGVRFMVCAMGAVGTLALIITGNAAWILPCTVLAAGIVAIANLIRLQLELTTNWKPGIFALMTAAVLGNASMLFSAEFYLWSVATVFAMLVLGLVADAVIRFKSRPVWINVDAA